MYRILFIIFVITLGHTRADVCSLKQAADFVDNSRVGPSIGRMQVWMRTSFKLLKYILGSTHFPPNVQPLLPLVKVKCIMGHRDAWSDAYLNKMGVHMGPTSYSGESKSEQVCLTLLESTGAQKCPGNQVERSPTARLTHLYTVTSTFPLLVDHLVPRCFCFSAISSPRLPLVSPPTFFPVIPSSLPRLSRHGYNRGDDGP